MKHVMMYTTPTCHYCQKAKELMDEKGIEYTEINVAGDPERIQEMVNLSGQMGVPVFSVDGAVKVGFDKNWLLEKVGLEETEE